MTTDENRIVDALDELRNSDKEKVAIFVIGKDGWPFELSVENDSDGDISVYGKHHDFIFSMVKNVKPSVAVRLIKEFADL